MMTNEAREFASGLGSVTAGLLQFPNGISGLAITSENGMLDLYRARFSGAIPEVDSVGGVVSVRYPRRLSVPATGRRRQAGGMVLNDAIAWGVEIGGGCDRILADFSEIGLRWFEVGGGASDVSITLPRPIGSVRIRIGRGASNVVLRRPAGVAVHLRIGGGASNLTVDDQHFNTVSGGIALSSHDDNSAAGRYDVEVAGGANALTISQY